MVVDLARINSTSKSSDSGATRTGGSPQLDWPICASARGRRDRGVAVAAIATGALIGVPTVWLPTNAGASCGEWEAATRRSSQRPAVVDAGPCTGGPRSVPADIGLAAAVPQVSRCICLAAAVVWCERASAPEGLAPAHAACVVGREGGAQRRRRRVARGPLTARKTSFAPRLREEARKRRRLCTAPRCGRKLKAASSVQT